MPIDADAPHTGLPNDPSETGYSSRLDGEHKANFFPVSFGQEGLWLFDQWLPGNIVYNMPVAVHLKGPLDVAALSDSFNEIRRRHEICRTTVVAIDGRPMQVIAPFNAEPLPIVDLESLSAEGRLEEAVRLASEEAQRPFDLAKGPLLRILLIRLCDDQHVLVMTLHHIIADAWSISILFRELQVLYAASVEKQPPDLPELRIQYADFAVWQRQQIRHDTLEADLAYWRKRLQGMPRLDLSTEGSRPADQAFRGAERTGRLPVSVARALKILSRQEGVTLFTTLLAAFQGFLARYTGQSDIPVVCSVAQRDQLETEPLIGFFVNLVVIRTDVRGNPTFRQLLGRVREVTLEAYEHQHVPFEMVVGQAQDRRDPTRPLLGQVGFSFAHDPGQGISLSGLTVTQIPIKRDVARTDLTLFVRDSTDGLLMGLEYNTGLFEEPTIDRMLEQIAAWLTILATDPERRLLMIPLFTTEMAAAVQIPPSRMRRIAPLGSTQRDLYLSHLINPDSRRFTVAILAELGSGVDSGRWHRAVASIAESDEMTRTRFFLYKGEPYQFVDGEATTSFEFIDLSPTDAAATTLEDLIEGHLARKYDLHDFQAPILKNLLIKRADGRSVAVLIFHHGLLDGTAAVNFFGRVIDACRAGPGEAPGPEYLSFYDHLSEHLATCDTPAIEAFWKARLASVSPVGCEPAEGRPPAHRVAMASINPEEFDAIKAFCRANGCSVPNYILALYGFALNRCFDPAGDVVIYQILNGRPKEHRATLGCFFQVLPVVFERNLLGERCTVRDYVRYVATYRHAVGSNQPISRLLQNKIVRDGKPKFFYNAYYFPELRMPVDEGQVRVTAREVWPDDEVHLIIEEVADRLELRLNYNEAYFADERFVERIAWCSRQLTAGVTALGELRTLLDDDYRQLETFNRTTVESPEGRGIYGLIHTQAEQTPDALAVIDGDRLTYRELVARADRWTQHLKARKVGPETLVVLFAKRSADFLAAMLAIFNAGGAYIPIDPTQPTIRVRAILKRIGRALLLAADDVLGELRTVLQGMDSEATPALLTMRELQQIPRPDGRGLPPHLPHSLAYVIYTSGSTGEPKGAMIEHEGLLNHLYAKIDDLGLSARDVIAQSASQSVDVSVWQFLAVLLVGGTIRIVPDDIACDPARLVDSLGEVTVFETVPSMFRLLLEELARRHSSRPSLSSLRYLIVNGEVLEPGLCKRWFEMYPGVPLVNAYGPTECSDDVTHHHLAPSADVALPRVPVGRVLRNLRIHVLNRRLMPVPVGVAGHLHVGGIGVGRGYLHDPARTAVAFVPDLFSETPGARLYRTGDRGRFLADGTVEFLGRVDHQVKVRGFRVELGEIEATLTQHPDVSECAVTTRTDVTGTTELFAYVVPHATRKLEMSEVRQFVADRLPAYMVPFGFVVLDALPLTHSGKIDRKALPAPQTAPLISGEKYVAPRTPTEETVAAVMGEVLGIERIGINDNFFELGGHSLLATQVISRLRTTYDIDLPLQRLFQAPTVSGIALAITQIQVAQHAGGDIGRLLKEVSDPSSTVSEL